MKCKRFFLLLPVPFMSFPRNHCLIQCLKSLLYDSFWEFIVLDLMIRSWIHFELTFICGVRQRVHLQFFSFLHVDTQLYYAQSKVGSCFFIHSAKLFVLIGEFNSLTFKVITDKGVLLSFYYLFYMVYSFLSLIPCIAVFFCI